MSTFTYKLYNKHWNNNDAFRTTQLYLNLLPSTEKNAELNNAENNEGDCYDLGLLTSDEAKDYNKNGNKHWFSIGDVLGFKEVDDVEKYVSKHVSNDDEKIYKSANDTLLNAYKRIRNDKIISYYLEDTPNIYKVLDIFIRVNSGGTQLTHSDLLRSIATAQWDKKDARKAITTFVDEINKIDESFLPKRGKEGFFNQDFVLRNLLVLSDLPDITFHVTNFNKTNMKETENRWDTIKKAILIAIRLVVSYGYRGNTLASANVIIPIAYYIMKKGWPDDFVKAKTYETDSERIQRWLALSLVKRTFSRALDRRLKAIRKIIKENYEEGFPFRAIVNHFKDKIILTEGDITNLLDKQHGERDTFSILTLLYPPLKFKYYDFHKDHIYAQSLFNEKELRKREIPRKKWEFYLDKNNFNSIANLQLLGDTENLKKGKTDFKAWLHTNYNEQEIEPFKKQHYIPSNISLEFNNFEEFIKKRKELLSKKLNTLLCD